MMYIYMIYINISPGPLEHLSRNFVINNGPTDQHFHEDEKDWFYSTSMCHQMAWNNDDLISVDKCQSFSLQIPCRWTTINKVYVMISVLADRWNTSHFNCNCKTFNGSSLLCCWYGFVNIVLIGELCAWYKHKL